MEDFSIYNVTIILGIIGFFLLVFTFLTGARIIKFPVKYRIHRRTGIVGFVASAIHAIVMLYFYLFS